MLERQRLNKIEQARPARIEAVDGVDPVVAARDAAILAALRERPMNTGELLSRVPRTSAQSDAQAREALLVALRRLALKKRIFDVGELWKVA